MKRSLQLVPKAVLLAAAVLCLGATEASAQTVSTFAGNTPGYANAAGTSALFDGPDGIAVDAQGNIYVSDTGNRRIRKITPGGVTTTLAGSGAYGSTDGPAAQASFIRPAALTVDASGIVYVIDQSANKVRKINPAGVVSTLCSIPRYMSGIVTDPAGNVYVSAGYTIRKVTPAGVVTILAGSDSANTSKDGTGSNAYFSSPANLAIDPDGNLYTVEYGLGEVRKISPAGVVTTISKRYSSSNPNGVAYKDGYVYVGEHGSNKVTKWAADGNTTSTALPFAGNGTYGTADGPASTASFSKPRNIAVFGNTFYVADQFSSRIRKIE